MISVVPVLAQSTVWRIDSEHSTARLFLASSRRPDASINVGVARTSGEIEQNAGGLAPHNFDFTIYPADETASQARSEEQRGQNPPDAADYTVISFKAKRVATVDGETFHVTGELTLTYVERTATYDPSEAYSGPVYGPAVTHSVKQEAVFAFHQVDAADAQTANDENSEWSGSSTIRGEAFPELLQAVATADWPRFVADEKCEMPSNVGEDFSGPICTGKPVDLDARKDVQCEMPATVGEDFAGEVCTGTPLLTAINDAADDRAANQVVIQLDLRLTRMNPTVSASAGE